MQTYHNHIHFYDSCNDSQLFCYNWQVSRSITACHFGALIGVTGVQAIGHRSCFLGSVFGVWSSRIQLVKTLTDVHYLYVFLTVFWVLSSSSSSLLNRSHALAKHGISLEISSCLWDFIWFSTLFIIQFFHLWPFCDMLVLLWEMRAMNRHRRLWITVTDNIKLSFTWSRTSAVLRVGLERHSYTGALRWPLSLIMNYCYRMTFREIYICVYMKIGELCY